MNLRKRFRSEVRERPDIVPGATVVLSDAQEREGNTLAARTLLEEIFGERITVTTGPDGILCGSREEAGAYRLSQYTKDENDEGPDLLLSSLPAHEIETFLSEELDSTCMVFVPDTAEVRFIERLAEDFSDVRFGI